MINNNTSYGFFNYQPQAHNQLANISPILEMYKDLLFKTLFPNFLSVHIGSEDLNNRHKAAGF